MSTGPSARGVLSKFLFALTIWLGCLNSVAEQQDAAWKQDLSTWREQHAEELKKPDGWLALAALVWLEPGDNSVGSAADNKVRLPASGPAHVGVLHLEGT